MARGPAYPFVDLEQAVEFANKMYQYSKRSPAQADSIISEAWGYSPTSSGSKKTVAALKYFGLIDELANNDGRVVKLSDRAYRIIVDDVSSIERRQALRDAALSPRAYLFCWNKWGRDMPPSMRSTLLFDEGFIESTVDSFITDYKKSIEFAGLLLESSDDQVAAIADNDDRAIESVSIGDSAQAKLINGSTSHHNQAGDDRYRSDLFSLSEGTVTLVWPKSLSKESFQDLSDWLDLMKRKIERSVG